MIEVQTERKVITNADNGIDVTLSSSVQALRSVYDVLVNKTYNDKIMAFVREYWCNAADANNDKNLAVDIHVPTALNPIFYVRDYGPGLNKDEIREIFAKIGESTKRLSNDQIGMMGIGAKAGFAYGREFSVTSFYDGKKLVYIGTMNSNGLPTFVEVCAESSNEPSGVKVEVSVPQHDIEHFQRCIKQICFWTKQKYNLLGNLNNFSIPSITPLYSGSGWELYKRIDFSALGGGMTAKHGIVTGGVFYDFHSYIEPQCGGFLSYGQDWYLVYHAPLGDVSFSASREQIERTDNNIKKADEYFASFKQNIKALITANLDKSENIFEFFVKRTIASRIVRQVELPNTWRGIDINLIQNTINCDIIDNHRGKYRHFQYDATSTAFPQRIFNVLCSIYSNPEEVRVVSSFDPKHTNNTRKFRTLMSTRSKWSNFSCILIKNIPQEYGSISEDTLKKVSVNWSTIAETKLQRSSGNSSTGIVRPKYAEYYLLGNDGTWKPATMEEIGENDAAYVPVSTGNGKVSIYCPNCHNAEEIIISYRLPFKIVGLKPSKLSDIPSNLKPLHEMVKLFAPPITNLDDYPSWITNETMVESLKKSFPNFVKHVQEIRTDERIFKFFFARGGRMLGYTNYSYKVNIKTQKPTTEFVTEYKRVIKKYPWLDCLTERGFAMYDKMAKLIG